MAHACEFRHNLRHPSLPFMTRCLVILVCALLLSPLKAMETVELFRFCWRAKIVLVIQAWSPEARPNRGPAKQPVFPDSLTELLSRNFPDDQDRVDALIKALAPPLASQDFHIFRVGEVLWIAPQDAPPLFNASLHLAEAANYSLDAFMEALAPSCDSTVPPAHVQMVQPNGMRIRMQGTLSLSFDPGDWSLARALHRFARVNRGILGWKIFCCPGEAGSSMKYYFEAEPVTPPVIPTHPQQPFLLERKPLPKIAGKKGAMYPLLRINDPPKY
jgi:hypothetical protein